MKALWTIIAGVAILLYVAPVAQAGHHSYAICPDRVEALTDAHRQLPAECRPIITEEERDSDH
jgi:hypothetical protein